MCIELPKIVSEIRKVDDKCLISSNFIADLDGYITTQQQTG
jgi:uncharacterized membrane-anchored protein YitT (DUF2179 family)